MIINHAHNSAPDNDDEISMSELSRLLWNKRKSAIKIWSAFALMGLLIAVFSARQYTAFTTMVPQLDNNQSRLGGLSGLAALAGFNLNLSGGNELSPKLYPQIVSSVTFQLELMNTPIMFEKFGKPVSLYEYFTAYYKPSIFSQVKKYTLGLPGIIQKAIKVTKPENINAPDVNQPIRLTQEQIKVQKRLENVIELKVNEKDGYITLSCEMPEATAAASLAQCTQHLLQKYITEFKIEKARANEEFIQGRYNEIKKNYENAQIQLANYRDRNKNVSTSVAQAGIERLNAEFNLQYNVYSELAKQLEQAKIQVKQETPVFTVIEPVSVPTEKSKPNRPMILFIWVLLGVVFGAGFVFSKEALISWKDKWKEAEN